MPLGLEVIANFIRCDILTKGILEKINLANKK